MHERKLQTAHDELMKFVAATLHQLARTGSNIPIVTDEEKAICSAIDKYLPGTVRLRCWNHTLRAAKYWLRNHGATSVEIPFYVDDLRKLFHSASESEYLSTLSTLKVCINLHYSRLM